MKTLENYIKNKDFLICVDSDGCAMDTMDIKHIRCFGPCMVEEWGLQQWQDEILYRWNEVNLYTMTRGINRFKGLSVALTEVNTRFCPIEGVQALAYWAEHSDELSNDALMRQIDAQPNQSIFQKALNWSNAVNTNIKALPESEIYRILQDRLYYDEYQWQEETGALYDQVRGSVNLTVSALLISVATGLQLPLSTT